MNKEQKRRLLRALTGIFVPHSFVDRTGDVAAAYFLAYLNHWADQETGLVCKTIQECQEETGLARCKQASIRKKLISLKLIEEFHTNEIPSRLCWRLTFPRI